MDLFDGLTLIGGLSLFLFGMSLMGEALEKRAGGSLKALLGKLTTGKLAGLMTGLGVTAIIQSSSATTVMVVGFVNSGLMSLRQAINVIMGANVGTTVTAWILSLSGLESSNVLVRLLKPSSFTPILALCGVVLYMTAKNSRRKDTGLILLGFATLMFGMETMSGAVAGLRDVPEFANILLMFSNPLLGVAAGAVLTAVIQSSSASVGILQALCSTGQVTIGAAIPIIMGQNIGTCVTAMLSSVGANRSARRAAIVHLCFNIIGTLVWLAVFCALDQVFAFTFTGLPANQMSIAVIHSVFNVMCTLLLLPCTTLLERLAYAIIPDTASGSKITQLDERLMSSPAIAIGRCRDVAGELAGAAITAMEKALPLPHAMDEAAADEVRRLEDESDKYEDMLGNYLVRLSSHAMNEEDSTLAAELLCMISDFERISDHAVAVTASAEEISAKQLRFSEDAQNEMKVFEGAVREIISLTREAFMHNDLASAERVEPLEEVICMLKNQLRTRHVLRLQNGSCSIEAGFVLTDLLTNMERVAAHCSNIAGRILEQGQSRLDLHEYLGDLRTQNPEYASLVKRYERQYSLMNHT
ncbi:MAG: Na/Pi cotransporter family protein [bacterium]|nr:Na/Pi cotransporter family protein [bacterium]